MSDRWGPEGPPDDAYSRVTRDLAEVTADYAAYLDGLPARLTAEFECRVRPVTEAERDRLGRHDGAPRDQEYAVEPADPAAATLMVARWTYQGGAALTIAFGRSVTASIPPCFCDACDEGSDWFIQETESYVVAATGGFHEFRRPYANPRAEHLDGGGPWLEKGFSTSRESSASASASVQGDLFEVDWREWQRR